MVKGARLVRFAAAGSLLIAAAALFSSSVHAQEVRKTRTRPAQAAVEPADRAGDAMRREVDAKARELEANFARIKELDPGGVVAVQPPRDAVRLAVPFAVQAQQEALRIVGRAAAVQAPAVADIKFVNAGQTQQFAAQFRALLKAEYQLLVTACEPTKDQRREIARAGENALKAAVTTYADWQRAPKRRGPNGVLIPSPPDMRKAVQVGLSTAAAAHLSPAQMARYFEEVKERTDDQRQATVLNLVAKLDERLHLSEDQRGALSEALTKGWSNDWAPSLQMLVQQNRFYPALPDNVLGPVLTAGQKRAWDGLQKIQQNGIAGYAIGMLPDPVPLEDAELDEDGKPRTTPNGR
jgi:hypothetical protein